MRKIIYARLEVETDATSHETEHAIQAMLDAAEPVADVSVTIASVTIDDNLGRLLGWEKIDG